MSAPPVSVVMAVRNGQRYVGQAIESVLGQTFKDFEFLIVDDASTDATPSILEAYRARDPRISVLRNERRLERSASRNRAIRAARGSYLAMIDADDLAMPRRLEMQLEHLDNHPELAMLGSWVYEIDTENRLVGLARLPENGREIRQRMLVSNQFVHPSVMARKSVVESVGLFDESLNACEDYALYFPIVLRYPCANLPVPLAVRRWDWDHEKAVHRHRRVSQLKVRLRLFRAYSAGPKSYIGLAVPLVLWLLPPSLALMLRRLKRRRRSPEADEGLSAMLKTVGAS